LTKRIPVGDSAPLAHHPFAGLAGSSAPAAPATLPATATAPEAATPKNAPAWAVVRIERKGRGGKEVTVVEKIELRVSELERWAKSLKQDLGCGGVVEGRTIVLQGDQRGRAVSWLEAKGVRKITRG
jgi:translation initiation factor 1